MRPTAPCLGCEKRHAYCHGNCEDYQQFVKENEERKKRERYRSDIDGAIAELERNRGKR